MRRNVSRNDYDDRKYISTTAQLFPYTENIHVILCSATLADKKFDISLLEHYTRWIDLLCSVAASKIIDFVAVELSTTDGEHFGYLAVDGNVDPRGLCARTECQVKPSWRLQLETLYIIRSVTIFTPECCRRFITN